MSRNGRSWRRVAIRVAGLAVLFFSARPARATIDYAVSVAHPERHIFGVMMRVPDVHGLVVLQMPAWNTLYQIRDFSSHVMQVTAKDEEGNLLPVVKVDKQTWQVTGNGTITVNYPAYWDEPGPFASQLNSEHAFLNLAMVLLYIPSRRGEDARLMFNDVPEAWHIAVELDPGEMAAGRSDGAYTAPSYDALVDAPVEIGKYEEMRFEAGGRPIRVVIHGDPGDRSQLTDALTRIVNYQTSLMGGAPFREFLFLFHVGGNFGGGGMEHANSTAISADIPGQLPSYSAHEFFHTWNVKRIRPQSLEPVDFTKEMWTRSLWFAEGVTNTYGAYTLVRTGLWSSQQFYGNLAGQINELESRPAHRWQSAEQSSLDAWLEKYPTYVGPEESISYYNKGQLLGVTLDILIRDATDNRSSLDDVLRLLNEEYAKRGRFYNESGDIRAAAENVIRAKVPTANADLRDFFSRYVSGIDEIPFADLFAKAGWLLKDSGQHRAGFGFAVNPGENGVLVVGTVDLGSSAQQAGLQEGDILLGLNGEGTPQAPDRWLRDHQPGERVTASVRRSGNERQFSFLLARQSEPMYQVLEMPEPTDKQRRIRDGILHGRTDASR